MCKIEWSRADLQMEFKIQGPKWKFSERASTAA
jgi:hypothetical protein